MVSKTTWLDKAVIYSIVVVFVFFRVWFKIYSPFLDEDDLDLQVILLLDAIIASLRNIMIVDIDSIVCQVPTRIEITFTHLTCPKMRLSMGLAMQLSPSEAAI